MKRVYLLLMLLCCCVTTRAQYTQDENFNKDWRFIFDSVEGAEDPTYNDSEWRVLSLPHDWAIEGPFDRQYDCRMGALPVFGTGWYRKHFTMQPEQEGKVVRIEFEGAMYNSNVWVNGEYVGARPYGYIGFEFDISKYLKYDGTENVIAVRLTPEDYSSRWYPGAGLYRSVWLKVDEPTYIDLWGVYITTPTVTAAKGVVQHETTIVNSTNKPQTVQVYNEYIAPNGDVVAKNEDEVVVDPNSKGWSGTWTNITEPAIWSVETPNLYTVVTTIKDGDKILDTYNTRFGIRKVTYDKDAFYINGEQVRFNGVCLHHDNGALGSAVYRRADERKLQIMKEMGVNAIRTSHNPPSREFLELCDELGLLVLDEAYDTWAIKKVENGYNKYFPEWGEQDLADMIRRDRSHPSVVMWSIGNEIMEQWRPTIGWKMAKRLNDVCKEFDTSRPTTAGFNSYPNAYDSNMAQQVDIAGANYKAVCYEALGMNYPDLPLYGSETESVYSSRGVYHLPIEDYTKHESLQCSSYDHVAPPWGFAPDFEFYYQKENPRVMGEFVWTGFDYLGETSPYGGLDNIDNSNHWNSDYPSRSSYFGIVDLAGFPKDRYYLYQSQWTTAPMIHLLPHWNWSGMEGEEIPIMCYTNCEEAELFVNGVSMGRKVKGVDKTTILVDVLRYEPKEFESSYRLSWSVPYEAGSIKVVGYKDGVATVEKEIRTAGKPSQIKLSADRDLIDADGCDLSYITVRIEDKDGNFCPLADNNIEFMVKGVGKIVGVDNGNPISIESFQASERKAFNGLALAILNSNDGEVGEIELIAKSKGLKSATIKIVTK